MYQKLISFKLNTVSLFCICICIFNAKAQENKAVTSIIQEIYNLEKDKDPKCYATANRLEDFMYGIPLTDEARNAKIDIQKELIFYLKNEASKIARKEGNSSIKASQLTEVLNKIASFSIDSYGNYNYHLTTGNVRITKKDFAQYSSVSYGFRSLLSVEQDLLYIPENNLLDFNKDALKKANEFTNLLTLVVLKVSDLKARKTNQSKITKDLLRDSWVLILSESENIETIKNKKYVLEPKKALIVSEKNKVLKDIINQKIASYKKYNKLTESVFLRNLQVYFARQKWPTDHTVSNELRSYYLESLISFTSTLIEESNKEAKKRNQLIIRNPDVEKSLDKLLPATTNNFEDVTFFPNNASKKITIESYDLDAFRDSGFHWRILGYSLDDLSKKSINSIDPNAAELLVEGIAQMGVLVLRLAGKNSHHLEKSKLDKEDITAGFKEIQSLIDSYGSFSAKTSTTEISSAISLKTTKNSFRDITKNTNVLFEHKSSDWLNRHIRSYTIATKEGKIKLAIPPAFGGSGVACEDINNDGIIDILLLSGFGNKLFYGSKKRSFTLSPNNEILNIWNDTLQSYGEPRQPIIADFNNDGLQDIFISYVNDSHKILQNIDGDNFKDVTIQANLGGKGYVGGPATAFDYNNDGLLDIYIGYFGNYIKGDLPNLSRDSQNGSINRLFKNKGDFIFEEVQLSGTIATNSGWTQALGHSDINQDGLQDIIVGNDFGVNKYYLNSKEGVFKEVSSELGTDKPSYTMNVGIADLNKDLYPDFYISNIVVMQKDEKYVSPNAETTMKFDPKKMANIRTVEANDLFISNAENDLLKNYELSTNIGDGYSATGWSWDADFFDFDNDGDEDLYCLNGMNDFSVYSTENPFYFERSTASNAIIYAESNREKNVFFVNENGKLLNKAKEYNLDLNSNARSASYFDFDSDGDLDILINNYHEKAVFLENINKSNNNWIKIKLIGDPRQKINRDAIGSSIILNSDTHKNLWREIHSTTGYLSVHPKEQHFGLGQDQKTDATIKWSNGEVVTIKNLKSNASYTIIYPNTIKER